MELLKDHPMLGAGLSGYPTALKPYHQRTDLEIFQYPHNIFLNIWVEMGLLGLIGFIFLIVTVLRTTIISMHSQAKACGYIVIFVLIQMFLHGLVDVPYFKNDLAILTWTLLAIFTFTYASKHASKN